ncbi:hypothetical protein J6590_102068 [Homalodisca vitripennis]|nr:hypothetical protein J6590_003820 [Homalodisca vitripennis]KAG8284481.1 hypothetical protein J6590_102068 [Homalodisca vitripennis]
MLPLPSDWLICEFLYTTWASGRKGGRRLSKGYNPTDEMARRSSAVVTPSADSFASCGPALPGQSVYLRQLQSCFMRLGGNLLRVG